MISANIYLNFKGNTEEAFTFYKSVFGGDFISVQHFKDTPEAGKLSPADQDKIMHIALPLGDNVILMGTDILESMGQHITMGDNFSISLDTETQEEATTLFNALAQGGSIEMPLEKMFWGAYFGVVIDSFGVHWMVNFDPSK